MLNLPRKVIYVDFKPVNFVNPFDTIKVLVDQGYNVINVAFWLYNGGSSIAADFALVWENATPQQRQDSINYAASHCAVIMVSASGSTETPYDFDPVDYGTQLGQFAANNIFDGIDFDLENIAQGFLGGSLTSQQTIDWIVTANNTARATYASIRGFQPIISHSPQAPFFGFIGNNDWAGPLGGYTRVNQLTAIDFYNTQFYNQG